MLRPTGGKLSRVESEELFRVVGRKFIHKCEALAWILLSRKTLRLRRQLSADLRYRKQITADATLQPCGVAMITVDKR